MRDEGKVVDFVAFGLLIVIVLALLKCGSQRQEDCARRKCLTGTPTWIFREGKCLCMILPE